MVFGYYLDSNTQIPSDWKIGTLRTLIKWHKTMFKLLLDTEIKHLRIVFFGVTNHLTQIVYRTINQKRSGNIENVKSSLPTEANQLMVP